MRIKPHESGAICGPYSSDQRAGQGDPTEKGDLQITSSSDIARKLKPTVRESIRRWRLRYLKQQDFSQ
jgi:hypothetical protein